MKYVIYKVDCPILMLSAITETGYTVVSEEDKALHFDTTSEAWDIIREIPNTQDSFWGVRPTRPHK